MKSLKPNNRILALLLAFVTLLQLIPLGIAASAEEEVFRNEYFGKDNISSEVDVNALYDYLLDQLAACKKTVSVSDFGLLASDAQGVAEMITYGMPEIFHLDKISYAKSGDNISKFLFTYECTAAEYKSTLEEIEEAADKIISDLIDSDLSDAEKVLLVHDRIAVSTEYNYEAYAAYVNDRTQTVPHENFTVKGALLNGKAVCEGYSMTNIYLLSKLGIKSTFCRSKTLGHGWNIVYIDGEGYHVDITWDDPVWDIAGRVKHDYFLLSSSEFEERRTAAKHPASDYNTTPSSTKYDSAYWSCSQSEFQYVDDSLYYVDNENCTVMSATDGMTIAEIDSVWIAGTDAKGGIVMWSDNFTRLASYGPWLFYTDSEFIYQYDTRTEESTVYFSPDFSSLENWGIYGLTVRGDKLVYDLYMSPTFISTTKSLYEYTIDLPELPEGYGDKQDPGPDDPGPDEPDDPDEPVSDKVAGDVNGDKNVNSKDVTRLMKYIAGSNVEIQIPDINGDGNINSKDVTRLMKYIAGDSVKIVANDPRTN